MVTVRLQGAVNLNVIQHSHRNAIRILAVLRNLRVAKQKNQLNPCKLWILVEIYEQSNNKTMSGCWKCKRAGVKFDPLDVENTGEGTPVVNDDVKPNKEEVPESCPEKNRVTCKYLIDLFLQDATMNQITRQFNAEIIHPISSTTPNGVKHWTRVSLLLELISSAYPMAVPVFELSSSDVRKNRRMTAQTTVIKLRTLVIDTSKSGYYYWLGVVSATVLYNAIVLPMRSAFTQFHELCHILWMSIDYAIDLVYLADIFVGARTGKSLSI
ncbi:cyclic nucleotide-gated olfactory channel [Clonorchis sinensis]|uniref:Cyclic nucleotide-gated olfactory channel n=1 Tax=Clonorchis sinensis TaxID=79923 RepID=G7YKA1_CLOSI|nr:cyclic nucleotide-gated olfactory channel [Clonorchis sinensis]